MGEMADQKRGSEGALETLLLEQQTKAYRTVDGMAEETSGKDAWVSDGGAVPLQEGGDKLGDKQQTGYKGRERTDPAGNLNNERRGTSGMTPKQRWRAKNVDHLRKYHREYMRDYRRGLRRNLTNGKDIVDSQNDNTRLAQSPQ